MASSQHSCLATERILTRIWSEILAVQVQPYDDFFDLGGDSMKVVDVVVAASQHGVALRSSAVFRHPTPARLAEHLTIGRAAACQIYPPADLMCAIESAEVGDGLCPVPIKRDGEGEPVFVVHSDHGIEFERAAALNWVEGRPILGFASPSGCHIDTHPESIRSIAERYVGELLRTQPSGRHYLVGIGSGAVVAFEMACILHTYRCEVAALVMIKPWLPGRPTGSEPETFDEALRLQLETVTRRFNLSRATDITTILAAMREECWYDAQTGANELATLQAASAALALAVHDHRPSKFYGPVMLVQDGQDAELTEQAWAQALPHSRVHWVNYGLQALRPIVTDPSVADTVRTEFAS